MTAPAATVVAALVAALAAVLVAARNHRRVRALEREKHQWELDRDRRADQLEAKRERAVALRTERAERDAQERDRAADRRARLDRQQQEERQLARYVDLLCRELGNLRILDMAKPLDLRQLYVTLRVRDDARTRFPRDEERATGGEDDPLTILERAHEELLAHAASAWSPEDALDRFGRIVVVGDPGAGKTTMLRHLALTAADGGARIPVYVELKDFVDSDEQTLLDHIHQQCDVRYGFTSAPTRLRSLLEEGKAVLLLDGLDETLGGATAEEARAAYAHVISEVERLTVRYPDVAVALTCRRAGWEGGLDAFRVLEVLDFSEPQVEHFVDRWFADDTALRDDLRGALDRNARMRSLAANPLLLSLICIVFERDLELPERRAELYNRCVEVLLKEWDSHRAIKRFSQFTTDRKRDLLEELAWHFHCRGARYFHEDELLGQIAEYLPTVDIEPGKAREVLEEIAAQYGLLKQQAHGTYGFLHLTLQEYFAAVAANERGREAMELVARQVHQPWWEEVALLLAGRMSDASPFLAAVLRNPGGRAVPGRSIAPQDNVLRQDLLFAARCLIGTPRVRQPGLREAIVSEVAELVATGDQPPVVEAAAAFLGELEDPAMLRRSLSAASWQGRQSIDAIVRGLVRVPSPQLAAALVPILEKDGFVSPRTAERALQAVVLADPTKGRALQRAYLRSTEPRRVLAAAQSLAGAVPDDLIPDLVGALSGDPLVAAAAARTLEGTGSAAAAGPLLERARGLDSTDEFALRIVVRAAVRLGGDEAVAAMAARLGHEDEIVDFHLLQALTAHPHDAAFEGAFRIAGDTDRGDGVRWAAIEFLGGSRERGEAWLRPLLEATSSPSIEAVACAMLVRWGDTSRIPVVRDALLDPEIRGGLLVGAGRRRLEFPWRRTRCLASALREVGDHAVEPQLVEQFRLAIERDDFSEAAELADVLIADGVPDGLARPLLDRIDTEMFDDASAGALMVRLVDEDSAPVVLDHLARSARAGVLTPPLLLEPLLHRIAEVGPPQAIERALLDLYREAPLGPDFQPATMTALAILATRLQRRLSS